MPGLKLTVTLVAAAAIAIGNYFFGNKDDDDDHSPPRDSYSSSSSYNSGTRYQTHQSYRPPPPSYSPPSPRPYSYYTPETNAQSNTTTRSPAPPDYGRDVYRQSVASTRTLRQTQPSTHTQASRPYASLFDHVRESPEYDYPRTSSHHICAESESRLPTAPMVVSSDLYSDKPAIVEDLEYAKKLREKARRKGLEMSEARSRAKSAQKKGSRGAAHIHKQEAMVRESEMKDLDKRAAKIIFRENNKNRKEGGKIDLHGLYVAEAIQLAKDQVQTARLRGDEVIRFIVGKGLHAEGGVAKIRPALENHFTKRGLGHSLDPNNAGVLIVRLD